MSTHGDMTADRHDEAARRARSTEVAALLAALGLFLGPLALLAGFLGQAPVMALVGVLGLVVGVASGADWLRLRRLAREAP